MEYWIVFRSSDGAELYRGVTPEPGTAALQQLPDDTDIVIVPREAVMVAPADLGAVANFLCAQIDAQAEAIRSRFLTAGEGQALTYLAKQQEAQALALDPQAPAVILRAEAAALGVPVEQVATQIRTAAGTWTAAMAAIEAIRRLAKKQITEAENLSAMKLAATVDWSPVDAIANP